MRAAAIAAGAVFGLAAWAGAPAAAERAELTPALALARLCQSEAGWTCFDTGDGHAIHEVLLRGAARQGIRYQTYARAYARRLFGARPHSIPRLRWSGQLNERGDAPEAWPPPPHAPWASYRGRWTEVLAEAHEVVNTLTLDDVDEWGVCESEVHDWGGWMDRARAERIGLVPVPCGVSNARTRNDFYCRPSLGGCIAVDRD